MHQIFNMIESTKLDHIYREETKYIDVIPISENLSEYLEKSKLFEIHEIVNTDYRGHIIDMNLEEFFKKKFSTWDRIDKKVLDLNKRLHWELFDKYAVEILDYMILEEVV